VIILVQGWSSFSPSFSAVDFVSYYIELPVLAVMYLAWKLVKRTKIVSYEEMDLVTDVHEVTEEDLKEAEHEKTARGKVERIIRWIF
jgi:AAT family amino acid transporter